MIPVFYYHLGWYEYDMGTAVVITVIVLSESEMLKTGLSAVPL